MSKLLEVCVDSYESAVAAINGGANRLELCSSLIDGGLTPTPGLLMQILEFSKQVPVFCMLRCRPGDFVYTQEEIEIMKKDAAVLQRHGANGFVFGSLNSNGEVDMKPCREIILACFPLPVTFHRAFDLCKRPTIEIEVIIDLGFKRILTSGQQSNAQLGVKMIKKLLEQIGDRIVLMPGGGINKQNIAFIVEHTQAKEYHGSFKKIKRNKNVDDDAADDDDDDGDGDGKDGPNLLQETQRELYVADREYVAEIAHILKTV